MADPEFYGNDGVALMKNLVTAGAAVTIPMINNSRGVEPAAGEVRTF
jgi:hypothetical protein